MAEKKPASLWWLVAGSAILTACTYKVPEWTGIRVSREWPIASAVLLMVLWVVWQRRHGFRAAVLSASIVGIGIGLLVAKLLRWIELGQPIKPMSVIFSVIVIGSMTWLLFRTLKGEELSKRRIAEIDEEFEAIRALPVEERASAYTEMLSQTLSEAESVGRRSDRIMRWMCIPMAIGMILTIVTMPLAFKPEPKPFHILLSVSILLLGAGYFWLVFGVLKGSRARSN